MIRTALLSGLVLLAACSHEVSPGRDRLVGHSFRCSETAAIPPRVRTFFTANGIRFREQGDARSLWIATGERDASEYAVQIVGPDATTALYVRRGQDAAPDDLALIERLSTAFAACQRGPDPIR